MTYLLDTNTCIFITNNVREFKRVSGLKVEDWTRAES